MRNVVNKSFDAINLFFFDNKVDNTLHTSKKSNSSENNSKTFLKFKTIKFSLCLIHRQRHLQS